jgi:GNAT superfamily N-acetyltransferase
MPESTNPSNFSIFKACEDDMHGIFECVKELAVFEKEPDSVITNPEIYLNDWLKAWFDVLVAKADQKIVGIALYHPAYSSWRGRMMYLDDLIVTEDYRGMGIGKALLEAFLEESKKSKRYSLQMAGIRLESGGY